MPYLFQRMTVEKKMRETWSATMLVIIRWGINAEGIITLIIHCLGRAPCLGPEQEKNEERQPVTKLNPLPHLTQLRLEKEHKEK